MAGHLLSLLTGDRDAVLIDALVTFDEAKRAAEWIRAHGKRLTTIYLTHGHGDHMFGLAPCCGGMTR